MDARPSESEDPAASTPVDLTVERTAVGASSAVRGRGERLADFDTIARMSGFEGEIRLGRHDRMLYATDASSHQVEPIAVVVPRDAASTVLAVEAASMLDLPVLPRGGGTSLGGQCTAEAVVIDVSAHVRGVTRVDETPGAAWCRAEAGITIADLNAVLADRGLFFAPDPSTVRQANIGGCIGNNAAGTRSIRYGRTSENVRAIDACLADGSPVRFDRGAAARAGAGDPVREITARVIDTATRHAELIRERFPRTLRRNAGYALDMVLDDVERARASGRDPLEEVNLAHLLCGSEGTLAVTLAADLDLHPIPQAKGLAVIGFDDLDAAIAAVEPLLETGPSAVELLDDLIVTLAERNRQYAPHVRLMPPPASGAPLRAVLYVEFWESSDDAVRRGFDSVRRCISDGWPGASVACLDEPAAMAEALALRSAGEPLLHAIPGSRRPVGFVEDNVVPVGRLREFVRRFRGIVDREDTRASFYAHASVGVLHVRPLLDLRDEADRGRMERIAVDVADLARELGGVMSGEHGDGRVRGPLLERHFGPELMGAFREVKDAFDPCGLLNPGNIVGPGPIESIHERLRVRPAGENVDVPPVETWFAYEHAGGFDHAVELCNGAGVCRKNSGGTMCPSYRATRDERHSTRGRGNALRLAVTGQLGGGGRPDWNDPETLATLDLCLSCKACASECPSNVDVATYKAEYQAQSHAAAGSVPLRAKAFGRVRTLNRIGSALAPASNVIMRLAPVRAVTNRVLGIASERRLPEFSKSLRRRLAALRPSPNTGLGGDAPFVILYEDCFSAFNEPEIGLAAIRLLNAFGYRVELAEVGCCGRPPISTGLLDEASACRSRSLPVLAGGLDRGAAAIVVLEPSCLSAIRGEWLDLRDRPGGAVPGIEDATRVAENAHHVETFLHQRWDDHPVRPRFRDPGGPVAFHGHCHQKALGDAGEDAGAGLLARIAGDRLTLLDTGCCGMAGSFGYAASRYGVSMAVGEDGLFPQLRELDAGARIAMPGTSCRHQAADGVARVAEHPVVIAADLLGEGALTGS